MRELYFPSNNLTLWILWVFSVGSLSCVGHMVISHVKSHGSAARVGLENALVLTVNIHAGELEIQSSWACVYATLVLLLCQETSVAQMFRWRTHKPTQGEAPTPAVSYLLQHRCGLRPALCPLRLLAPCSEL